MRGRTPRDRLTTTIERDWLADIIAGRKRVELRKVKPYWTERFARVGRPFELRMINGMGLRAPEATVLVARVTRSADGREYRLHIARVLAVRNWDRRRERPAGRR
jgi:hypothetical protein